MIQFQTWRKLFFFFYQYGSLVIFVLTKCSLYGIYKIFWPFFGTITYSNTNFCFKESIFQWQFKLISYRSEFWLLRRKSAVIFSKLKIQTCEAPQNDRLNLSFVKDDHTYVKKKPEMVIEPDMHSQFYIESVYIITSNEQRSKFTIFYHL